MITNFGTNLAQLRKDNGMTQQKLASTVNVTPQAVSRWEKGDTTPDFDMTIRLAALFNVSTDYLLTGELPKTPPTDTPPTAEASHVAEKQTYTPFVYQTQNADDVDFIDYKTGTYGTASGQDIAQEQLKRTQSKLKRGLIMCAVIEALWIVCIALGFSGESDTLGIWFAVISTIIVGLGCSCLAISRACSTANDIDIHEGLISRVLSLIGTIFYTFFLGVISPIALPLLILKYRKRVATLKTGKPILGKKGEMK